MDCEKFDRIVLDLLEGELDELTSAAARRHTEHCARCRNIAAELRATRAVGVLPLVEVPDGLELRILEAERQATQLLPIGKRLGRGLSLLAGYAMRPQLAMAALLMLLIGSSLFFLRAQPGDRDHVLVTERGVPESDNDSVRVIAKKNDMPESVSAAPGLEEPVQRRDRLAEAKTEPRPAAARAPTPAFTVLEAPRGVSSDDQEGAGSVTAVRVGSGAPVRALPAVFSGAVPTPGFAGTSASCSTITTSPACITSVMRFGDGPRSSPCSHLAHVTSDIGIMPSMG